MDKNSYPYQMLVRGLNNGAFSRISYSKESHLYWLPSANSGVPITPKKTYFHEVKFLSHDIYHQLMPDIVIDTFKPELEKVYIYGRVISEVFTMVLADYLLLKEISLKHQDIKKDVLTRKIYMTMDSEYKDNNFSIYQMFKNHMYFSLLGTFKYSQDFYNFDNWANNVYTSDFQWSVQNYNKIKSLGQDYINWAKDFKLTEMKKSNSNYLFLSDFNDCLDIKNHEELALKIFDILYQKYYLIDSNVHEHLLPLESREQVALSKIKTFNKLNEFEGKKRNFYNNKGNANSFGEYPIYPHFTANSVSYFPKVQLSIQENFKDYNNNQEFTKGLYSASFDLLHKGHMNIIDESSKLVDILYVGVATKKDKNYMFTLSERLDIVNKIIKDMGIENAIAVEVDDEIPKFMERKYIRNLFRGVRNTEDFLNEYNRLESFTETYKELNQILLFGNINYHNHSSSRIKKLIKEGYENLDEFISPIMEKYLKEKMI